MTYVCWFVCLYLLRVRRILVLKIWWCRYRHDVESFSSIPSVQRLRHWTLTNREMNRNVKCVKKQKKRKMKIDECPSVEHVCTVACAPHAIIVSSYSTIDNRQQACQNIHSPFSPIEPILERKSERRHVWVPTVYERCSNVYTYHFFLFSFEFIDFRNYFRQRLLFAFTHCHQWEMTQIFRVNRKSESLKRSTAAYSEQRLQPSIPSECRSV